MKYLSHINLTTGHASASYRADIGEFEIGKIANWLMPTINTNEYHALPAPFDEYAIKAFEQNGSLVVTTYGKAPEVGVRMPLITFGVAHRSRQSGALWDLLTAPHLGAVHPSTRQPKTPWLAVHLHPSGRGDLSSYGWLADFECTVAWAWITRQTPDVQLVK